VSGNGSSGILVANGSDAAIGGTTVSGNGTVGGALGRMGINVYHAAASLVGNNSILNNGETGVLTSAGQVTIGDVGFGLTTTNTISGNGATGPNRGGVFAFEGGVIRVTDATISNNTGTAVQAFEGGIVELRGATAVTVPGSGTTAGALVQFGSSLRLRDTASIVSATGPGIQASELSAVNIRDGNTVQGNGAGRFGVECFTTAPLAAAAATLTGNNLANVSGAAGPHTGCNVFP
jgi:Right handed beta helix region